MARVFNEEDLIPIPQSRNRIFTAEELSNVPVKEEGFIPGIKAGLTAQPGKGVGHFIGAAIPASVGAALTPFAPPVGAALGEAARQTAGAVVNPEATAKKSPISIGAEVAGAGVGQKIGDAAGPYIAKAGKEISESVKGATDWLASRIGKQFIKASKSINAYGHKPEKALVDEGIFATSWEELLDKVKAVKDSLGTSYDELFTPDKGPQYVSISKAITPINTALCEARKYPGTNASVINKLNTLKSDIINRIRKDAVEVGEYEVKPSDIPENWTSDIANTFGSESKQVATISKEIAKKEANVGPHLYSKFGKEAGEDVLEAELMNKKLVMPAKNANAIKREIYKLTKYTGKPSDDAALNKTKQYVASAINKEVEKVVPEIKPINERYANLIALENAAEYRAVVAERNNLVGIPEFAATGALLTGGPAAALATEIGGRFIGTPTGATAAIKGLKVAPQTIEAAINMVGKIAGGISAATIDKAVNKEREDHPTIPEEYLPHIVADEIKKDPNFYDKESVDYSTPEDIKAAYKSGKLDKATAVKMLRENHGFK